MCTLLFWIETVSGIPFWTWESCYFVFFFFYIFPVFDSDCTAKMNPKVVTFHTAIYNLFFLVMFKKKLKNLFGDVLSSLEYPLSYVKRCLKSVFKMFFSFYIIQWNETVMFCYRKCIFFSLLQGLKVRINVRQWQ